jgi:hypothetical protein
LVQQADAREDALRLRRLINFKFRWIQFSCPALRQSRYFCGARVSMFRWQSERPVFLIAAIIRRKAKGIGKPLSAWELR